MSSEATFHKAVAPLVPKRMQGMIMGAFRKSQADGIRAFAEEVKQLCEDYSGRDNVYIKDVQASIDALAKRFIEGQK